MTAATATRTVPFVRTSIGLKVLMAVTGILLFGFVAGHVAGNLLIFAGSEKLNAYARFLRDNPLLLWGTRLVLLASVLVHIAVSIRLTRLKSAARPIAYEVERPVSTYASRTMMWSGPVIALFVVYHLLHFTFGTAHPDFRPEDVYRNVVVGFRNWAVAAAYAVSMLALGLHLSHGLWSLVQTLGLIHPRFDRKLRCAALGISALIVAGFLSIPVAVVIGWVK